MSKPAPLNILLRDFPKYVKIQRRIFERYCEMARKRKSVAVSTVCLVNVIQRQITESRTRKSQTAKRESRF